jgi:hypothetical protein
MQAMQELCQSVLMKPGAVSNINTNANWHVKHIQKYVLISEQQVNCKLRKHSLHKEISVQNS